MDGRRSGNPDETAIDAPAAHNDAMTRRRLLVAIAALALLAEPDLATARRRTNRRHRRRGRGPKCHGGLARMFAAVAERAPSGDGDGGEVTVEANGGSIVHGDIGPNADVTLSADGGQRTADASGGDGHVDIPPDFEDAVEACKDRRRRLRRRKRRRR